MKTPLRQKKGPEPSLTYSSVGPGSRMVTSKKSVSTYLLLATFFYQVNGVASFEIHVVIEELAFDDQ